MYVYGHGQGRAGDPGGDREEIRRVGYISGFALLRKREIEERERGSGGEEKERKGKGEREEEEWTTLRQPLELGAFYRFGIREVVNMERGSSWSMGQVHQPTDQPTNQPTTLIPSLGSSFVAFIHAPTFLEYDALVDA